MSKQSFTHYYVQAKKEGGFPEIVYHTFDEDKKEYYHEFLYKKDAIKFADAEKKVTPEILFRVMKCIKTYEAGQWI